ncbi:AzlC family ABC transporter permease [Halorussus halophilus]|uniref:AzlC family ABC transporter permease n=1 Tax=Halorussus halophilus TaxID=2650975 RepID=UPI001CE3C4EC|nr:AzlC family ABC transporter permease [Halorussus halophilus]
MSSPRADFLSGVRVAAPILLGVVPFGMVAGVAAVGVGIPAVQALAMSVIIFAGASQLAAIELVGRSAPVVVVVLTVFVVNLRMVMYSASIAPYFESESPRWKAALSYFLTDQAYAVSLLEFENDPETSRRWYYLGVGIPLWVTWQAATIAGIVLGAQLPAGWHLEFAVPLVFLAVLVPAVTDRSTGAAAVVGGTAAVVAHGLPYNLGLVTAAVVGIAAGLVVEEVAGEKATDETNETNETTNDAEGGH